MRSKVRRGRQKERGGEGRIEDVQLVEKSGGIKG